MNDQLTRAERIRLECFNMACVSRGMKVFEDNFAFLEARTKKIEQLINEANSDGVPLRDTPASLEYSEPYESRSPTSQQSATGAIDRDEIPF